MLPRPRLLLVTQDYPPTLGGLQTYAHALARVLAHRCEAFCVLAPDQPGAGEFDAGQPFTTVRLRTSSDWMRLRVLPTLVRTTREQRLDTILTGQWYVAAAALAARRIGVVRQVFSAAHGQELIKSVVPAPLTPLYERHRRAVLRGVDGLFPVSRYTASLLTESGVDPSRVAVINNGTDLARFDAPNAKQRAAELKQRLGIAHAPTLVTVARLMPRKGIDTVISALPGLIKVHRDLHYLIAGAGPDEARLRNLVAKLALDDRCHFLGAVANDELPGVYHAGTVFVMPARAEGASVEGFGLAFCEAGACRKPVIGSRSGGIPDAVIDGETGLLVAPNDPEAFATAAARLLADSKLRTRLGAQGRARIEQRGTWEHAAEKILRHMCADPPNRKRDPP